MKHLKKLAYLFFTLAIMVSCDKDLVTLEENSELNTELLGKESSKVLSSIPTGELYALQPWETENNVGLFNYDPITDDIVFNEDFSGSTGKANSYGFDFNYEDGLIYLLSSNGDGGYFLKEEAPIKSLMEDPNKSPRYLYTYNKDTDALTLIDEIVSFEGNNKPQDLTFGNDGTLYFIFSNGEVNAYNIGSKTMSFFCEVHQDGAVGLTFNYDSNQLIFATSGGPVYLYSIDIPSAEINELFSFYTPVCYYDDGPPMEGVMYMEEEEDYTGSAQAIEYIGNNKVISSSTWGCDIIYTVDLVTEDTNLLLSPTGFYEDIKDLMYYNNDADGDGCIDKEDAHIYSNLSETVVIDGCDSGVSNELVSCGTFMMDEIDDLIAEISAKAQEPRNRYQRAYKAQAAFKMGMYFLLAKWQSKRYITRSENSAIMKCVGRSTINFKGDEPD